MQVLRAPGVASRLQRLVYATHAPIEFVDVTAQVAELVHLAGLREGVANVFSRHTTAAVCIQEAEPLLLEDLCEFLQRKAPAAAHYRHNDFRVRTVHMHDDERENGHAHCLQLILGSSEAIPVADGQLLLGEWQRIFLVELDGPRENREIVIQVLGTTD